jgi:hypothetical protein
VRADFVVALAASCRFTYPAAMATQSDVRRIALSLPETREEEGRFAFSVLNGTKYKGFAWVWMERVHPRKPRAPCHEVLALRVANLDVKEILLMADQRTFFTEPHYEGFPAVLVRLKEIGRAQLHALLIEAWTVQASKALRAKFKDGFIEDGPTA